MKKKFELGKVAYYGTRKINAVDLEVELEDTKQGPVLSVCGNIWNSTHNDVITAGQCIEEINEVVNTEFTNKITDLWHKYHLNSMHAGTEAQEAALEKFHEQPKDGIKLFNYTKDCEYLESIGLLVDNGYKYGTKWLYREIPEADLEYIKNILK